MRRPLMKLAAAALFVWATIGFGSTSVYAVSCTEAAENCESQEGCFFDWNRDWEGNYCYWIEPMYVCHYTCECQQQTYYNACEG